MLLMQTEEWRLVAAKFAVLSRGASKICGPGAATKTKEVPYEDVPQRSKPRRFSKESSWTHSAVERKHKEWRYRIDRTIPQRYKCGTKGCTSLFRAKPLPMRILLRWVNERKTDDYFRDTPNRPCQPGSLSTFAAFFSNGRAESDMSRAPCPFCVGYTTSRHAQDAHKTPECCASQHHMLWTTVELASISHSSFRSGGGNGWGSHQTFGRAHVRAI